MSNVKYESLCFEDVAEGEELPPLSMTITWEKALMTLAANREWNPFNYDRDFCQKQAKIRDTFVHSSYYFGVLIKFVTDWAGPAATVSKLRYQNRETVSPGDDVKIEMKVAAKRVDAERHLVDLDFCISNQFGPTTPGMMTIELPSRAES